MRLLAEPHDADAAVHPLMNQVQADEALVKLDGALPISAATSAVPAVTHGIPSATQFPKKMSANDSPTSALMPQRSSACGACSREEPQPKFLLTIATRGPFA